ncbi:MAG: MBL fold metallo-hydrolase [Saprospiraceae bacterium]
MKIKQFEDKNLAHFSYAISSNGSMAIIDPSRNPKEYLEYAKQNNTTITAVIETHPHADFVSSHLEIYKSTGATIFVSKFLGAEYPHQTFDDGDVIHLGFIQLIAMNTPGHSPDSISILAKDEKGREHAIFTGDTLFIGDCGRPDLREQVGNITAARKQLAEQMYESLRHKIVPLHNDVIVYPAHGSGSLCGKALSSDKTSTIGLEKLTNWSLQDMSKETFIDTLLTNQPFIPKYFQYNVTLNKKGAPDYQSGILNVKISKVDTNQIPHIHLDPNILIIDTRHQLEFKKSHLQNAINLMNDVKFETWLGSIVNPMEPFYLIGETEADIIELIDRIAKIGYENQIQEAIILNSGNSQMPLFESDRLKSNEDSFTIVDVRNQDEVISKKIFTNAIHIPLHELRERTNELPTHKPILVHCAGGYRSAAGSSIIDSNLELPLGVYDLSDAVKSY